MKHAVHKAVAIEFTNSENSGFKSQVSGFTLIELLVVISIIAILAGILLPVVRSGITKAEKARALADLSQIVSGMKAYYAEYGRMPVVAANNDKAIPDKTYAGKTATDKQNVVMNILRGLDSTNNPKGTAFIDLPKEAMTGTDKDNQSYADTDGYFLDPWGNPYVICVDANFDGNSAFSSLATPPAPAASLTATSVTAAVVSYGPDLGSTKSFLTSWGKN